MGEMDDMVKDFLVEGYENLDKLDAAFVRLEHVPTDRELLASIFRSVHTIKGNSGFFGFTVLQGTAHAGETLMAKLRDGALVLDADSNTALLQMVDAIRTILGTIEHTGQEGTLDTSGLVARLLALAEGRSAPAAPVAVGPVAVVVAPHEAEAEAHTVPASASPSASGQNVADQSIRVDVGLLDELMNLVGELVLTRNQLIARLATIPQVQDTVKRLDQITSLLQESAMKTRMQPIAGLFSKIPRVVRDLAQNLQKQIRVELHGQDTELDKSVLEAVKDPLTHMIRNAVDHGIETPEVRMAAGKPAEGVLKLRAFHGGGMVNIEISDDGRGIDPERIRQKALEKGLITVEQGARMAPHDLVGLIFAPGFSTAEQITSISGRGVGMDVVRTNIERIGGTVDIDSVVGRGSTFRVKIPLTLAIIPALVVRSGGERFAIPQLSLVELVRLTDDAAGGIEDLYGSPVYRRRGRLLPLVRLNTFLGLPATAPGSSVNLVVLQADDRYFGLIVDQVVDTGEIVVKSLDEQLKQLQVFAGATIMGDGSVALILDVMGLGLRSGAITANREAAKAVAVAPDTRRPLPLVVFRSPDDGRMAVPLRDVIRLEKISSARVERTGDIEVMQYRDGIVPLVRVFDLLPERRKVARAADTGILHVVIRSHQGRTVGLVVGEILDTVEVDESQLRPPSREGIASCVVIAGKVAEIFDVERAITLTLPILAHV